MPYVQKIIVFPIKSLDGVVVGSAAVSPGGALMHDREFAIFNKEGRTVNGKKYPAIHKIRSQFDLENRTVSLAAGDTTETFHLDDGRHTLNQWFSDYFNIKTELRHDPDKGFPDDVIVNGPTVVSEATLKAIQSWFPGYGLDNVRRRFRANIELGGCDSPFWEDRLYGQPDGYIPFKIGAVAFRGIHPCQRCVVPSRDPFTGETDKTFQRRFAEMRQSELPAIANRSHFDHFYRLSVNTKIEAGEEGKNIAKGDSIQLL